MSRGKKQFRGHLLVEADLAGSSFRRFSPSFALFQRADARTLDAKFEYVRKLEYATKFGLSPPGPRTCFGLLYGHPNEEIGAS